MNPLITIAVQCHNFQRRLCWLLSSLKQQSAPNYIVLRVDYMPGNGTPTTLDCIPKFIGAFEIDFPMGKVKDAMFEKRGFVRNRQLVECKTEWLLFSDVDHVFHPEYFERLAEELKSHKDAKYLIAAGRRTTDKDVAITLVDHLQYPCVVEQAFKQAISIKNAKVRPPRGIGNFQLVNVKHGAHGGYYVPPDENKDRGWSHKKGQNTKSDMQFRKRMIAAAGPVRELPEWFTQNVVHLNHERDADIGKHCEVQR